MLRNGLQDRVTERGTNIRELQERLMSTTTWAMFLMGKQTFHPEALEDAVYDLVNMTTQKTDGRHYKSKGGISFENLEAVQMAIICEASALVLSGRINELKKK